MKINNSPPKATLYTIENDYINKLKAVDSRVQNNYKGQRLYYKSCLEVENGINYYVPLSSAKESQKAITNKSVFKLFGDKEETDFLGVLHINNLIPVPDNHVRVWSPRDNPETDERYTTLVIKQSKYIKAHEKDINEACELLRASKLGTLDPKYFSQNRKDVITYKKITSDLNKLEEVSKKEKNKSISMNLNDMEFE